MFEGLGRTGISPFQAVLLALAAMGLCLVLVSSGRRFLGGQRLRRSLRRASEPSDVDSVATVRDAKEVMVQLDQVARRIHGRLDAKLDRLESLLREADQRIDQLARSVRAADGRPVLDVTLQAAGPKDSSGVKAVEPADPAMEAVYRLADGGLAADQIAQELGKVTGEVELILGLRRLKETSASLDAERPLSVVP
jgi:CBS-domain-containing membrane protein